MMRTSIVTGVTYKIDPLSKKLRENLYRQSSECFYCTAPLTRRRRGKKIRKTDATVDHKIQRYVGGTDEENNLVVCCNNCNGARGSHSWEEWLKFKQNHEH